MLLYLDTRTEQSQRSNVLLRTTSRTKKNTITQYTKTKLTSIEALAKLTQIDDILLA